MTRIVLSDGYHVRQYGGLKLVAKDQGLWLLYSAKEPEKDVWHAYVQQMEEEMGEPQELPGTYEKRPVLQAVQEGRIHISFGRSRRRRAIVPVGKNMDIVGGRKSGREAATWRTSEPAGS